MFETVLWVKEPRLRLPGRAYQRIAYSELSGGGQTVCRYCLSEGAARGHNDAQEMEIWQATEYHPFIRLIACIFCMVFSSAIQPPKISFSKIPAQGHTPACCKPNKSQTKRMLVMSALLGRSGLREWRKYPEACASSWKTDRPFP